MFRIVNRLPVNLLPIGGANVIHLQEITLDQAQQWAGQRRDKVEWEVLANEETLQLLNVTGTPFPEWPHWGPEDEILLCQPAGKEMRFFLVWLSKR